jgi:hypothetical protein
MPPQSVWSTIPLGLPRRPLVEVLTLGAWVIVLLFVIALGLYLWNERTTLWSLLTLTPLAQSRQAAAMVGLLFFIPLALAVLGANTFDVEGGTRYLLISWQASSIMLAIFFTRFAGRFKALGLILMTFYVLQMGLVNLLFSAAWYFDKDTPTPYAPEEVSALEDYLSQNDLWVGYAHYWDSYTLDFVTEERLTIAPFNGADRYPKYSRLVADSPVQVFVFRSEDSPPDTGQMEDLVRFLTQEQVFPPLQTRLADQVVVRQHRIASWEVWVVGDP